MSSELIIGLALAVIAAALTGFAYMFFLRRSQDPGTGLFAPRTRRIATVERTPIDGGRKLLLVRRDNVEHLILVGGPIDLVIETGISARPEANGAAAPEAAAYAAALLGAKVPKQRSRTPYFAKIAPSNHSVNAPSSPLWEEPEELTALQEVKS